MSDRLVMNVGCGPAKIDGWVNVDDDASCCPDVLADMRRLPFDDGHFDAVASNHALQMLPFHDLLTALIELRRVTRADGVLRLVLPDFIRQIQHRELWEMIPDDDASTYTGKLCLLMAWRGETRSLFTPAWTRELLLRSGWHRIADVRAGLAAHCYELTRVDSRPDESLFIEAMA